MDVLAVTLSTPALTQSPAFLISQLLQSLPASLIPLNSPVSFLTPCNILSLNFSPSGSDYFSALYAQHVLSLLLCLFC